MEAWDQAFGEDKVWELVDEMQKHCDAVIEANGNYIPYCSFCILLACLRWKINYFLSRSLNNAWQIPLVGL